MAQTIPCPTCSTPVPVDSYDLLNGVSYTCPGCASTIAVAMEKLNLDENTKKTLASIKAEREKGGRAPIPQPEPVPKPELNPTPVYITQLIYLQPGQEDTFLEFESVAIPLMEAYNGQMILRLKPGADSIIQSVGEIPYEVHFLAFGSDADLNRFLQAPERQEFLHLKEKSIRSVVMVKGKPF